MRALSVSSSLPLLCPHASLPLREDRCFPFSHWPQSNQEKLKAMRLRKKTTHTPHFYDLEIRILQAFITSMCKPDAYLSELFRVFSEMDEPSRSQLTGWDKYSGRLYFREGKYKWFVTLINFKHSSRNTIWHGIQRGNSPSTFNSGGWKTVIEFPS